MKLSVDGVVIPNWPQYIPEVHLPGFEYLMNRDDYPAIEHSLQPHLMNLDDVGWVFRLHGGNGLGHDLPIVSRELGLNLDIGMGRVKPIHDPLHRRQPLAAHGMPEADLCNRVGGRWGYRHHIDVDHQRHQSEGQVYPPTFHISLPLLAK